jgi:tRNA modification GTPase
MQGSINDERMNEAPPDRLRVVRLTPPGRGAVASLLVEGTDAASLVEGLLRTSAGRTLRSYPAGRLVFAHVGPGDGEEVVVRLRCESEVELHCHGGTAAVAMVEGLLIERGCQSVTWRQWAARSHGPIEAAALEALAEARTERTAAVLLDQYQGALRRELSALARDLAEKETASARRRIEQLLSFARLGQRLTRPWQVAVAGRPNVGKSSLINALLGYRRAIVDPSAGTTRDVVSATTALDGWPVEFSDTAGIRESDDPLEQAGIELARRATAVADLVLLVFDATQPQDAEDRILIERLPDALVVFNKSDLLETGAAAARTERSHGILVSAIRGDAMEALTAAIRDRLVPAVPPPGTAVPFTARQVEGLETARAALLAGDHFAAIAAVEGILAPDTTRTG